MKIIIITAILFILTVPAYADSNYIMGILAGTEINTGALAPDYGATAEVDLLKRFNHYLSFGVESMYADTITAMKTPQEMLSIIPSLRVNISDSLFADIGVGPAWNTIPQDLSPTGLGPTSSFSIAERLDIGFSMPISKSLNLVTEAGLLFDSISSHVGPVNQWTSGVAADFSMGFFFAEVGINFGF